MKKRTKLLSFLLSSSILAFNCKDDYRISSKMFENSIELSRDKLSADELEKKYYDFFTNYKVRYNLFLGLTTDLLDMSFKTLPENKECDYQYDGNIQESIANIIDNTNKYIEENKSSNYINAVDVAAAPLEYQKLTFNIVDTLMDEIWLLKNGILSGDNNKDLCKINDLVILLQIGPIDRKTLLGDYVDEDNKITLYIDNLKNCKEAGKSLNAQTLETLVHELNHSRQYACDHQIKKGQSSYLFPFRCIVESSAESAVFNERNSTYYDRRAGDESIYFEERCLEQELQLLTLMDDDANLNDYYASVFTNDMEAFLDHFSIKTAKDKKAMLHILLEVDIEKMIDRFLKVQGLLSSEIQEKVSEIFGYGYKVEIIRMALKNVIENNMEREDKLTPLQLSLLGNFIFNVGCEGTLKDGQEYDKHFVKQVNILSEIYTSYISDVWSISKEEAEEYMNLTIDNYDPTSYGVLSSSTVPCDYDEIYRIKKKFPKDASSLVNYSDGETAYQQIVKTKTLKR